MIRKLLPILLLAAAAIPATALTEADLAPAALVGKTLTFTVEPGAAAPLATNGTWTGTFGASPGNVFTKTRVSGDSTSTNATWSFNGSTSGLYEYTIVHFLAGRPNGILTLWISGGVGRYEVFLNGTFGEGSAQIGGFTIGGGTTPAGEIAIGKPGGGSLADGAKFSFGTAKAGSKGIVKTFTLRNTGDAALTGLAIRKSGANKGDFTVAKLAKTSLAAGAETKFKVTFKPAAKGTRKASIRINGAGSDAFDISLSGKGTK